ncbi:hypothetical protein [Nesterenkonia halotolerans]|uniref:DUF2716 domain-containing protein n=1 Tax=Nesterenkonia halotolerans TaxID=225325 RepID=A0ABR9J548_9MICC|nr:hypothetical protein [Nesterenkonia halotolerans]MBE1514113.1 hypothetical protein [Nesterenkonia halotolerans]
MEAEPFGSVLSIVPRGYEMYARVFHPLERDRPVAAKTWLGVDEATYFEGTSDIDASLETERTTWASVAEAFGTTMHSEAQYARLQRSLHDDAQEAVAPDGWRYGVPSMGSLEARSLSVLARVLARHTATPDAGIAAVWEGWGGLVSSAGVQFMVVETGDGSSADHHAEAVVWRAAVSFRRRAAAARRFSRRILRLVKRTLPTIAWNTPKPGSGVLPPEIATGPRFDLHGETGRHYFLFQAGAEHFSDPDWPARAPWAEHPQWVQSPSLLWPDDHSWVLATEIDCDSTLVAGTSELIGELMQTPGLEVLLIRTNADLTWDGDGLNRPV